MGGDDCRIYVGNLPPDIRSKDIEDFFYKFGKITFVDLKNRKGPPFAFVEFEDRRDAEDAVRSRDGFDYDGYRLRVEFPRGGGSRGGGGGRGVGGASRRSNYRVVVSGLPPSGSWQDLKDHMREAGDVCFADVNRDGTGVVEFLRAEDMKYALRKLDDSKFRSHEAETAYIRVREESDGGGRSPRRSRSPRDRDRDRDRDYHRSSNQRRRSPSYDHSRRISPAYDHRRRSRSRSPRRRSPYY